MLDRMKRKMGTSELPTAEITFDERKWGRTTVNI
jgi:hypothetical protein